MITVSALELQRRPAHPALRRRLQGPARRPDRPGRPQRRRARPPSAGAGRRERCRYGGRVDRPRRRRLPAAGPADRRPDVTARDRVLSARGLDELLHGMAKAAGRHGRRGRRQASTGRAVHRTASLEERFAALGGYAAESRGGADLRQPRSARPGPRPAAAHPLGRPAAAHRAGPDPLLRCRDPAARRADQPPRRRLDRAGCATSCAATTAGWSSSATTSGCSTHMVNKVFHLDAEPRRGRRLQRGLEGLPAAAGDRRTPPAPRAGQRREEGRRADRPRRTRCAPRRPRPSPRRTWCGGPSGCWPAPRRTARADRVARVRFPKPAPCGRTPLTAAELSKSYGSLEVFTDVDLAVDRGGRVVILGLNGAGKTTLLRVLAGVEPPDTGAVVPGHGLRLGYYAQEHETLDIDRTVLENMRSAAPDMHRHRAAPASSARSCSPATWSTSRPARCPAGRRPGSPWPAWSAPRQRACCSTSPPTTWTRRPGRRCSARSGLRRGDRAGDPRRGCGAGVASGAGDPAARRDRGCLERGVRRSRGTGLIAVAPPGTAPNGWLGWPWSPSWVIMGMLNPVSGTRHTQGGMPRGRPEEGRPDHRSDP